MTEAVKRLAVRCPALPVQAAARARGLLRQARLAPLGSRVTLNGSRVAAPITVDYAAEQAFYLGPGHAPAALEDSEYIDFSPTDDFERVISHITRKE